MKNKSGFTIVELLVVTAVLATLAMMASSKSSRTSSKAKQAQVKALLAGIYTTEKVFYAEYNSYTPYMSDLNFFATSGFYDLYYNVGFFTVGVAANESTDVGWANGVDVSLRNGDSSVSLAAHCTPPKCKYVQAGGVGVPPIDISQCPLDDCVTKPTTFKVLGAGFIQFPTTADTWTMDEGKTLRNTNDGAL